MSQEKQHKAFLDGHDDTIKDEDFSKLLSATKENETDQEEDSIDNEERGIRTIPRTRQVRSFETVSSLPMRSAQEQDEHHTVQENTIEPQTLVVPSGIQISGGEMKNCLHLIVEGDISIILNGAHTLDILADGVFTGDIEVENADISGLYSGSLIVRDTLVIRKTGKVQGKILYNKLSIEAGGMISGETGTLLSAEKKPDKQSS